MPVIQTYEQQFLPQGQLNVQATPEQMGAGVGRAISDLADTFDKIEQDKGQVWAYKTSGEEYEKLRQRFSEDMNGLDPNDPEFNIKLGNMTSNFQAQIDKATSDLVANAPSVYAARAVEMQMLNNKRSLLSAAVNQQANVVADYTKSQLDGSVLQDQNSVASDPSDDNFNRILNARKAMIGGLNNISPAKKAEWIRDTARDLAIVQATTLAMNNPDFLLKSIDKDGGKIVTPDNLPADLKADTVKAYKAKEIEAIVKAVAAPSKYDETFKEAARLYNMDWRELKMRAVAESALNPTAVSSQNAGGIMQFTPETAADLNVDRNDPVASIRAAAKLLSRYSAKAGGDMTAVDKMYYGGEKGTAWGPNTKQYAANLAAVRIAMGLGAPRNILPQVQMLPDETIDASRPQFAGAEFLSPLDRRSIARTAEGQKSQKLSLEQAELSNTLKDVVAVLGDGKDFPGIEDGRFSRENLFRVFGPQKGEEAFRTIENYKRVGPLVATLAKMPNSQVEEAIKRFEPKPGEGYADDKQLYATLVGSVAKMQKDRKTDYMAWALNQDGMNVKPIEFGGDKLRETLVARIPAALVARQAHGIDAPPLSKEEAAQLSDVIQRGTATDAVGIIKTIRQAFRGNDNLYVKMMGQIGERLPNFAYAGNISPKQGYVDTGVGVVSAEAVAEKIVSGSFILGNNSVDPNNKTPSPVKMNQEKFRAAFNSVVDKRAFALPDEKQSARMLSQTLGAVQSYVAARIMEDGGVAPDNYTAYVKEAVKAVTGGTISYARNSNIFLPWGIDQNTFESVMPAAVKEAITNNPPLIPTPMNAGHMAFANGYADGEYIILNPLTRQAIPGKNGAIVVKVKPSDNRVLNAKFGGQLPNYMQRLPLPDITDGN